MSNNEFQRFFEENDNSCYNPRYLITILESSLENNFDAIKAQVASSKVTVNETQIQEYLDQRLEEENPELKKRIEKRILEHKNNREQSNNFYNKGQIFFDWQPLTDKEIEESSERFADDVAIVRYNFEPYTLKYFNKYINIVKSKLLTLLDIIEKIGDKNISSIQDVMNMLDIVLDENGNITKDDIVRLLTPTIYNYEKLNEMVKRANDLSTYLTFKMSKHSLLKEGLSESEIYPSEHLQNHDLYGFNGQDNVPLSKRQEQNRREEERKSAQMATKLLLRLW